MRREISVIQKALQRADRKVKLTKTWIDMHNALGVGEIVGASLILSTTDRDLLRDWVKNNAGIDPLSNDNLGDSRMDVALQGRDEKLASGSVFGSMIQVARANGGAIDLTTGSATVPPGSLLSVDPDHLKVSHETIILVENGAVMRDWHRLHLPDSLQSALLIYRGHGENAADVLKVLSEGGASSKIGFFDFDPAGLQMGLTAPVDALLIPAYWKSFTDDSPWVRDFNKPSAFWQQGGNLRYLDRHAPDTLKPIIEHIKQHLLALTQEHLVSHEIPLRIFRFSPDCPR